MSWSESDFYMVISCGGFMQRQQLGGSTGFTLWIHNEAGSAPGAKLAIPVFNWGFPEPSLMWLLPGWEVHWAISDIPGTISRDSRSSPNVVGAGAAASSVVCGLMTARTINSHVPYSLSLSQTKSAASLHPGCVNVSSFISFCQHLSLHCCSVLEIVPITQPALSSSLSLPCSVS